VQTPGAEPDAATDGLAPEIGNFSRRPEATSQSFKKQTKATEWFMEKLERKDTCSSEEAMPL
jgi:hypothetical protein